MRIVVHQQQVKCSPIEILALGGDLESLGNLIRGKRFEGARSILEVVSIELDSIGVFTLEDEVQQLRNSINLRDEKAANEVGGKLFEKVLDELEDGCECSER